MPVIIAKRWLQSHPSSPPRKSPRRCTAATANSSRNVNNFATNENQADPAVVKPRRNPKDGEQIKAVKLALPLSTASSSVVCCEEEQNVVSEFCKGCVEHKKAFISILALLLVISFYA